MKSNAPPHLVNHEAAEAAAAAWLARQDNAETWSEEDERALQGWLEQHTAHRVAWLRLRQAWLRADGMRELPRGSPLKLLPYLQRWIASGQVSGETYTGKWANVGSPADLAQLDAELRAASTLCSHEPQPGNA